MQIFTFLMDFEGGTYVSQHAAVDLKLAVQAWVGAIDLASIEGIGIGDRQEFAKQMSKSGTTPLSGMNNVWCIDGILSDRLALVHIVKTAS